MQQLHEEAQSLILETPPACPGCTASSQEPSLLQTRPLLLLGPPTFSTTSNHELCLMVGYKICHLTVGYQIRHLILAVRFVI